MAKKPTTKEIQNKTFEFYPLSPKESLSIATRVVKLIAEPFGMVMDAAGQNAAGKGATGMLASFLQGELGPDVLGRAMRSLTERLEEKEVIDTCYMLLENVHGRFDGDRGTRKLQIEADFTGEFSLFLEVVAMSLEVNFGDFLRGRFGGVVTRSSPNLVAT